MTKRLDDATVRAIFKREGCELLGSYKNSYTPIEIRCQCGRISDTNWNNFKSKGRRCWSCGIEKRSGENNYQWRQDRDQVELERIFRQRCYKLIRMSLNATGRVKNKKSADLLGYDYVALQEHITSHPNWEKVKGGRWHIDHAFPIHAFVSHGIYDLKVINAIDNLQPLSASDNSRKNAAYKEDQFITYLESKGINHR